jgi:hypothetical protein
MFRSTTRGKVIPLHEGNVIADGAAISSRAMDELRVAAARPFPSVTTTPRLPAMIPDEILDYFGWVFCQGGFLNLHMTFEQFLSVVAAVSPGALCPEYDANASISAD